VAPDLLRLLKEAQGYKRSALALSTRKTYRSQLNSYLQFCLEYDCKPLPASQQTLCCYTAHLARRLLPTSIPNYLNVIRLLHLEAGYSNPLEGNFELSLIKKGIARQLGVAPKQKSPLTVKILRDIHATLDLEKPADIAFWAVCIVGFLGFLRKSTLLTSTSDNVAGKILTCGDVVDLCLESFTLLVRQSKVIQFGQKIHSIPFCQSSDFVLCPVRSVLSHFGASPIGAECPLFDFLVAGRRVCLTQASFVARLNSALKFLNLKVSDYSAHSLRRGGASLAFDLGLSPLQIKMRGDWSSNAYERYVFISSGSSMSVAKSLSDGVVRL
jgi:hypothetical protein